MYPRAKLVQEFGLGCHQYTDDSQLCMLMDIQLHSISLFWLRRCRLWLVAYGRSSWSWIQDRDLVYELWWFAIRDLSPNSQWGDIDANGEELGNGPGCYLIHGGPGHGCCQVSLLLSVAGQATGPPLLHLWLGHSDPHNGHLQPGLLWLTLCKPAFGSALEVTNVSKCSGMSVVWAIYVDAYSVKYWVIFKVLTLTSKALSDQGPYLQDLLFPCVPQRVLCSQDQYLLVILGPWDICLASTRAFLGHYEVEIRALWDQFRRACKMEVFHQTFGWNARCPLTITLPRPSSFARM